VARYRSLLITQNFIAVFAYPLITQIVDLYSKIYTQTQPLRFKKPGHHFVAEIINQQLFNLLNEVVCHQPDK